MFVHHPPDLNSIEIAQALGKNIYQKNCLIIQVESSRHVLKFQTWDFFILIGYFFPINYGSLVELTFCEIPMGYGSEQNLRNHIYLAGPMNN